MENKIIMYFEEEGCSSYSNRNIYATEVQKLELEYIKKVFRGMENSVQLKSLIIYIYILFGFQNLEFRIV